MGTSSASIQASGSFRIPSSTSNGRTGSRPRGGLFSSAPELLRSVSRSARKLLAPRRLGPSPLPLVQGPRRTGAGSQIEFNAVFVVVQPHIQEQGFQLHASPHKLDRLVTRLASRGRDPTVHHRPLRQLSKLIYERPQG